MDSFVQGQVAVVGVGDGGGCALNHIIAEHLTGIQCIALNTSNQALQKSKARLRVQIGRQLVKGQGTGGSPEMGKRAAEENADEIVEVLRLADTVFLVCALGGGTGTGAAPVVARIAEGSGARVAAVVSRPYTFEGEQRQQMAAHCIGLLEDCVNHLFVVPYDNLLTLFDKNPTVEQTYQLSAKMLAWQVLTRLV